MFLEKKNHFQNLQQGGMSTLISLKAKTGEKQKIQ